MRVGERNKAQGRKAGHALRGSEHRVLGAGGGGGGNSGEEGKEGGQVGWGESWGKLRAGVGGSAEPLLASMPPL